jgi:hypothetical protein
MALGGIGTILLIIVIVVIIIAIWNRRVSVSRHSDSGDRQGRSGRRFRVKAAANGDQQDRFEVKRSRHRRSRSRSRRNSASEDNTFIPQGLGQFCLASPDCASGLACENGKCVCPQPPTPTVTAVTQGTDSIVASWTSVPGGDFYEVILYRVIGPNQLNPVEVVTVSGRTTITFGGLVPGNYQVFVRAGSNACGITIRTIAGIDNVTLGVGCTLDNQCPANSVCRGGFCVPTTTLTGRGIGETCPNAGDCATGLTCDQGQCICRTPVGPGTVTLTPGNTPDSFIVTWSPATGATIYQVTLFRFGPGPGVETRVAPTRNITDGSTSVVFSGLIPGANYFAEVVSGSLSCGISPIDSTSRSAIETLPALPCPNPLPPPTIVSTTVAPPDNPPLPNGARAVTVIWNAVPRVEQYLLTLTEVVQGTSQIIFRELEPSTSITLILLPGTYTLDILSISAACGLSVTSSSANFIIPTV